MSAQKALEGSETETRELLGGSEENSILPDEGSLICPPGKLIINKKHKKSEKIDNVEKIDLVARPEPVDRPPPVEEKYEPPEAPPALLPARLVLGLALLPAEDQ